MKKIWMVLAAFALSACASTTDVYFPKASAEKAADRVITDIWPQAGLKGGK